MTTLLERLRVQAYARGPGHLYDPAYRRLAGSLELSEGAMLDVGCGPGWICVHAAAGHPELDCVGIDRNPAMIALAERNRGRQLNCTFRVMDAAEIRYPEDTFDRVITAQSMHHWAQPGQILTEIMRVLKPGGLALLCDADPASEVPGSWVRRRGPWPPDVWIRAMWRRYSLGDEGFAELRRLAESLPGASVSVDRLGFYRRIVLAKHSP